MRTKRTKEEISKEILNEIEKLKEELEALSWEYEFTVGDVWGNDPDNPTAFWLVISETKCMSLTLTFNTYPNINLVEGKNTNLGSFHEVFSPYNKSKDTIDTHIKNILSKMESTSNSLQDAFDNAISDIEDKMS